MIIYYQSTFTAQRNTTTYFESMQNRRNCIVVICRSHLVLQQFLFSYQILAPALFISLKVTKSVRLPTFQTSKLTVYMSNISIKNFLPRMSFSIFVHSADDIVFVLFFHPEENTLILDINIHNSGKHNKTWKDWE